MRLVLTDAATLGLQEQQLAVFERFGKVDIYSMTTPEQTAERIADAHAVICNKTVLHADVLSQAPFLKYIGLFATGYNNVDIEWTRRHGITVCNVPDYSTDAVAQHTFALLLEHYSGIAFFDRYTRSGDWQYSKTFSPFIQTTYELAGKTLGIVGFGNIGKKVAQIAAAFGMRVLVYTRTVRQQEGVLFVPFEQLLAESDVVSVHCPLNAQSDKLFDSQAFEQCKKGAYFINTARGGIVDETALRDAVLQGRLSGAAVDVVTQEPMRADCPLYDVPGITVTPHVAWAPLETRNRLLQRVTENIEAFLRGEPQNTV